MAAKPQSFDDALAHAAADQRAALEKLRKMIKAAAPKAVEGVNYGIAVLFLHDKPLIGLGASAKHCSFFPMTGHTVAAFEKELAGYDTSKGAIRFPADKPMPATLVRKIVKVRIAEIEAKAATSKPAKRKPDPEVVAFLKALDHPLKKELEALRKLILGISPEIQEGIKWNSPSFRTTDWFATINVHGQDSLRLILHTGATVKASATNGVKIADPAGLLNWLAKDRAMVTLAGGKELKEKGKPLAAVLKHWVKAL